MAVTLTGRVKGPKSGAAAAVFMEQMVGRNERRYSVSRKAKQINLVYNEMLDAELVHRLTGSVHHMGLISAMRSLLGAASLHPWFFVVVIFILNGGEDSTLFSTPRFYW